MKQILFAVFCVIVCGCIAPPECESNLSYPHWTEWDGGRLISIVDDSLAILASQRYKKECKSNEETAGSRSGLFLVNYRTKQKPLLVGTYEYIFRENNEFYSSLNIIGNYFKDSSVLVIDNRYNSFGFWKIGTEAIFFKKYIYQENYALKQASPWVNENVLFKNSKKESDSSKIWDKTPVLNTENGQINMLDFSGEYEWLNKCLDVSYFGGKIACIRINKENNKFELAANNVVTYEFPDTSNYSVAFSGNYISREIRSPFWGMGSEYPTLFFYIPIREIHKIDLESFRLSNVFVPIWVSECANYDCNNGIRFYNSYNFDSIDNVDNPANFIQYTPRDLFEASN